MAPSPLAARVRDAGYTPGIRDLEGLLELFRDEDEDLARATERAVLRIEKQHGARLVKTITERATAATRPARGRLARLLGRVAAEAAEEDAKVARTWLTAALRDDDLKTRHTAARALGKIRAPEKAERDAIERALLEAWDAARDDADRRALTEALGKVGSKASRDRLEGTRAALMIDRTEARERPGSVDLSRATDGPLAVRFHARSGLETIVAEELGDAMRPRVAGSGMIDARLVGPLAGAAAIRTATHFGIALDPVPVEGEGEERLAEAVAAAVTSKRAMALLRTFTKTDGAPIRFRLAWARGGHRRALTWRVAELVAATTKELINDPTESTWEIVVDDDADRVAVELVPRGFVDERFAYRTATVAASSHPTIAAALARLAPARPDDVVWDPFVGAGAELVERARIGPYASLLGTDLDRAALDAARQNLAAAGVSAQLELADGTTYEPRRVTTIITNPPMGRRVQRGSHAELLDRFVDHAAAVLAHNGALVWAAPEPRRLHARAERAGLVLERAVTVDMGGFPAELSVLRKRGPKSPPKSHKSTRRS